MARRAEEITVETPLLERMAISQVWGEEEEDIPPLTPRTCIPPHSFTFARKKVDGRKVPQAIAHRGYKVKFPENTMGAFQGAVKVGAEAIETDIHLSKDNVVVLSHDPTLKRCFGEEGKVIDHDWEYLSKLRTIREPKSAMPRLSDLLTYLAQPGLEDIWILLDIKLDNNNHDVMRLIAETIRAVPPSPKRPWNERIVLGIWAAKYLPLCYDFLPGYPITHIGFSVLSASKFFAVPNISFNMSQAVLMTPWGKAFIRKAHCLHRPVFSWTVNDAKKMAWAIQHDLDGVITDDPKLFLEVRKGWRGDEQVTFTLREWTEIWSFNLLSLLFGWLFNLKFKFGSVDRRFVELEKVH